MDDRIEKVVKYLKGISWDSYNLIEDISIDKYNLDVEAEKMPMLIAKWSLLLAKAGKLKDKAKENMGVIDADLFERSYKEKEGKTTDAAVKAWIKKHPEHEEAAKKYINAESNYNHLWSAIRALEAKRESIVEESKLWAKNYFSRPNITEEVRQKAETQVRNNDSGVVEKEMRLRNKKRNLRKILK